MAHMVHSKGSDGKMAVLDSALKHAGVVHTGMRGRQASSKGRLKCPAADCAHGLLLLLPLSVVRLPLLLAAEAGCQQAASHHTRLFRLLLRALTSAL